MRRKLGKRGEWVVLELRVLRALKFMCDLKAPSKVKIFSSRLILGRLLTRDQLKKRGVLVDDRDCCYVLCFRALENPSHLFGSCTITSRIWDKVGEWIGDSVSMTNEELRSFLFFKDKVKVLDERGYLTSGCLEYYP